MAADECNSTGMSMRIPFFVLCFVSAQADAVGKSVTVTPTREDKAFRIGDLCSLYSEL